MRSIIIFIAFGTLLSMGLVRCIKGFKGLKVDIDPECVSCDYSLKGLDQESQKRCPECGVDLFDPNSVRFKKVKKNWKEIVFGLFLIVLAIGLLIAAEK